jgi:hypothetical protein
LAGASPEAPEGAATGGRGATIAHVRRVVFACALVLSGAVSIGGCYWLASYQDLTSAWGEAGSDTSVPPGDAGREGGPEAGPFCPADAGPLVYCMDFDGIDAASLGLGANQASAKVVTGTYVSPPSSLQVNLYAMAGNGGYGVSFPFKPRTVRLEFAVLPMVLGQQITTLALTFLDASTQTYQNINVGMSPDGQFRVEEYFQLGDGGIDQNDHPDHALDAGGGTSIGTWHDVVLTVTIDDQNQKYSFGLTVDGQVFENAEPLALSWSQGEVNLSTGVSWTSGNGPKLYFDNVRADFGL